MLPWPYNRVLLARCLLTKYDRRDAYHNHFRLGRDRLAEHARLDANQSEMTIAREDARRVKLGIPSIFH